MTLSIIVAITRDNAIGFNGDMLYPISADLKRFKSITMGHPIVMGRKTFESFPNGALPGRRNIVVTRNSEYSPVGAEVFHSLDEALSAAGDGEVFVIGGGEIYRQAMPLADRLILTVIDTERPDADTFFPEIAAGEWRVDEESEPFADPRSGLSFRYVCLSRG